MKLKKLYLVSAACALVVLSPLVAGAQISPAPTVRDITTTVDRDDDHDYGWIGLLGLIGLAGLMGKKKDDRRYETTTGRTDVNR